LYESPKEAKKSTSVLLRRPLKMPPQAAKLEDPRTTPSMLIFDLTRLREMLEELSRG